MAKNTYGFDVNRLEQWATGDFSIPTAPPAAVEHEEEPEVLTPITQSIPDSAMGTTTSRPLVKRPKIMVSTVSVRNFSTPLGRVFSLLR